MYDKTLMKYVIFPFKKSSFVYEYEYAKYVGYWWSTSITGIRMRVFVCVCVVITDTAHFCNNDVHFCLTIGTPIVEAYRSVRQTMPGFNEFVQNCF